MTKTTAQSIITSFEAWSPQELAMVKDQKRIGLQVGSLQQPVKHVMVALDVLEPVVDEAIAHDVDLIIAHHPLIFQAVQHVDTDTAYGRAIQKCLRHNITVYAAHTNLDAAEGGVNDLLAEAIGLENIDVFVPAAEVGGQNPRKTGFGRVGTLAQPMTLSDFAEKIKQVFDLDGLRVVGDLSASVYHVALLGGDGNSFMNEAIRQGVDVYLTGDAYYHTAHDAWMEGLNLIDPGHNVEKVMKKGVARFLEREIAAQQWDVNVSMSEIHTDPFKFL